MGGCTTAADGLDNYRVRTESEITMSTRPLVPHNPGLGVSTAWTIKASTHRGLWRACKRVFDMTFAFVLLVAAAPLLLVIAAAIKLDSPGPMLYRVRRVGYLGRPLMMLKFRKMRDNAAGGPLTAHGDPRLTRVGAILTRTRPDELPQLWDVLRGRMSVIGPRPEDPRFVALHAADYVHILSVRPGMTGLSQLAYAEEVRIVDDESPIEDYVARIMPQKLTLDTLYANHSSLRLDVAVVWWTIVGIILRRPVAVSRSTGRMNVRRRPAPDSAASTAGLESGLPAARAKKAEPSPAPQSAPGSTA
jgi:lipopolysaccharide/colanic/teichoic acid biosynthesis glycosyltransferase